MNTNQNIPFRPRAGKLYRNTFSGTIVKVTELFSDTVEYERSPVTIQIHENSYKTRSLSSFTKPIYVFWNCYAEMVES